MRWCWVHMRQFPCTLGHCIALMPYFGSCAVNGWLMNCVILRTCTPSLPSYPCNSSHHSSPYPRSSPPSPLSLSTLSFFALALSLHRPKIADIASRNSRTIVATADGSVYTFGKETGQGRRLKPGKGVTYFLHFRATQVKAVNVMMMKHLAQD